MPQSSRHTPCAVLKGNGTRSVPILQSICQIASCDASCSRCCSAAGDRPRTHPPNFRYDREIDIRLHPQKVEVRYTLQLSFWTIFADNRKLFTPEEIEQMGGKLREVTKRYCEKRHPSSRETEAIKEKAHAAL